MARFLLSTLIALLTVVNCQAARKGIADEFQKLRNTGSQKLIDRGISYVGKCRYDSALICFSVVANRYYEGNNSKEDIRYAIHAMQDIGILYMTCDYDYKKAYDYLLQAKDLAEENNIRDKLPNIYNSIANIL